MEIKNIHEYNPEYRKDTTLVWLKIGKPVGKKSKHLRKKKIYPQIRMDKITVEPYSVDQNTLTESRTMYNRTHEMIPVYLSYDFKLIGGFEQYELAKELELESIPFQRLTKLNKAERKQFDKAVHNRKVGNKKYKVTAIDGSPIYVSANHAKKVRETKHMASRLKMYLQVLPNFTFSLIDKENNYVFGSAENGLKLFAIRKKLTALINNRKSKQPIEIKG